jgi:hypothetical protein
MDVAALADLLHETSEHWYAAYMDARESGSSADEASAAAGHYMAEVKHIVVPAA